MRQQKLLTGKIKGTTGAPLSGECTTWRTSAGVYQFRVPPDVKLVEIITETTGGVTWALIANDSDTDRGCRVVIANVGGTVNIDCDWRYIAVVE